MRIHEIMPSVVLMDDDVNAELEEDRWSEVQASKPVPPRSTPIARAMDTAKRKAGRKNRSQKPSP